MTVFHHHVPVHSTQDISATCIWGEFALFVSSLFLTAMHAVVCFKVSLVHSSLYFITICTVRKIADTAYKIGSGVQLC